ncbi:MAG TPA: PGPGW domain-containing protein [Actinomycetota bacterium]|nr:PGPGW domain-containing protein [Actinomycetota bacterium]
MVLQRIAAARERQILSHAKTALADGEVIEEWVRIRHPEHRGSGFMYLTDKACIVYWSGMGSNPIPFPMSEVRSWGVDRSSDKGPVLGIETDGTSQFVQLIVGTDGMVDKVNRFLDRFAQQAPEPKRPLHASSHPSDYEAAEGIVVDKEVKNWTTHTKRVIITVVGLALIVLAVLIGFIPGPWSIPLVLAGLAVLAREYDWAQDLLIWGRERYQHVVERIKARRSGSA